MLVGELLTILIQMPASAGGLLLGDIPLPAALLGAPITAMMQGCYWWRFDLAGGCVAARSGRR